MYWQPNQYRDFCYNIESLKALSDYITNIHVFNWSGDSRYPLEESLETWSAYMAELYGKMHYCFLEFMPDDRIESLKPESKSLLKLNSCL